MFLGYEQVTAGAAAKDVDDLTIPAGATHAQLQASGQSVSYTMDGTTVPTQTAGMFLLVAAPPQDFTIDDILRIKFVRGAGSDGQLNIHYFGGRDV